MTGWESLGCQVVVLGHVTDGLGTQPWYTGVNQSIFTYKQSRPQITWQEAERKLDCLLFQVRLIWTQSEFFQVIWKHPALKLEQRVSPSDNFPLEAKRNQEETNYECMQNKPKLLFKFKKC